MPQTRLPHRADLEALRGLAILLVVAYHAGVPALAGGFVGVDVFFVLSGWFMARALVQEYGANGSIDLRGFYRRRALRLLPALLLVVAATLLAVRTLWAPIDRAPAVATAAAALTGTANIAFAREGVNYFAGADSPFVHLWSLGVELQVSLFGPLLLIALARLGGRRAAPETESERTRRLEALVRGLGVGLVVVGGLSLAIGIWVTASDPSRAYFSTFARGWEFVAGALLVLLIPAGSEEAGETTGKRGHGWWLQAGGLAALGGAALLYDRTVPYPGTAALLPVLGALAVIAGGARGGGLLAGQQRRLRALGWLAKLSYSWYLWHWPVVLTGAVLMPAIGVAGRLAWSFAALLPAWLTWRFVERPLRERRDDAAVPAPRRPILAVAGCLTLALVAVAMHRSAQRRVARGEQRAFAAARVDRMPHTCWAGATKDGASRVASECVFGDPKGAVTVALFGDSHAEHWLAAVDRLGRERGWRVVLMVMGGCPVADAPELIAGSTDRRGRECARYREASLRRLAALKPDVALLSSFDDYVTRVPEPRAGRASDGRVSAAAWRRGLRRTYARLAATGVPVVAIRGTPRPGFDVPACLSRRAAKLPFAGDCEYDREEALHGAARAAQLAAVGDLASRGLPVATIDMVDEVCDAARCAVVRDGVIEFTDDNHLTASFTGAVAPAFGARLDAALAGMESRLP